MIQISSDKLDRLQKQIRIRTARMRRSPDFLIIGAQKGGTTSLYRLLSLHPRVHPTIKKEIHYFDNNYDKPYSWYAAHFPLRVFPSFISGEASPYYIFHPRAPHRIATTIPDVRLIALLRDPVERAYSHYQHNRRKGREPLSFEDAIGREAQRTAGAHEKIMNDAFFYSSSHQHYTYLQRGCYYWQLCRFLKYFRRSQIFLQTSEQFFYDPSSTWRSITRFLELEDIPFPQSVTDNTGHYSEMRPRTRKLLQEYFKPHNALLAKEFGISFQR